VSERYAVRYFFFGEPGYQSGILIIGMSAHIQYRTKNLQFLQLRINFRSGKKTAAAALSRAPGERKEK